MKELSLNILDITENSVKAGATLTQIILEETDDKLTVIIADNGCGMSEKELEEAILSLKAQGAECIEMVTPTHYTDGLARLLARIKPSLGLPIVWNSGGYESVDSLKQLEGIVDVYMPDFKYFYSNLGEKLSGIKNYANIIEKRLDDEDCTIETLLKDNANMLELAKQYKIDYYLIDDKYEVDIDL